VTGNYDAIVIGTGGMGAAAARHLARRGARVLGLDRFPPPHDRGSSHGHTRLIRTAYYEHPDYVPLLLRARAAWRELEAETGRRLLFDSGVVMAGPEGCELIRGSCLAAEIHGLAVERLTAGEAAGRWPALRLPDAWDVIFEAAAGHLLVEDCVRGYLDAAMRAGADLRFGVTVHGWRESGNGVVVETDAGSFTAGRLVLCPGAWAAGLLRLPDAPLTVLRKSLFWFEPAERAIHEPAALPCFACDTPAGFFYGFPALDERGVKLAEHSGGGPVADPLAVDRGIDPGERRAIETFRDAHLPRLGGRLAAHATCLYTMTPDHHFLLGLHPHHPQVAIAAGFSGHGFKFASVVGEILADLATTGRTPHPIAFLAPGRFTG